MDLNIQLEMDSGDIDVQIAEGIPGEPGEPATLGPTLQAFDALTIVADTVSYWNSSKALTTTALTATGRSLLGSADAAAARAVLAAAPNDAQYLVNAYSTGLSNERLLTGSSPIIISGGGSPGTAFLQIAFNAAAVTGLLISSTTGLQAALDGKLPNDGGLITTDGTGRIGCERVVANVVEAAFVIGDCTGVTNVPAASLFGTIPTACLPSIAIVEFLGEVADETAMLALSGQTGDWCVRTDSGTAWIIVGPDGSDIGYWREMTYPASPVSSVNGQTGDVNLTPADVGAPSLGHTHAISSGEVTGLSTGVATFLGAPSSANLRSVVTDETGTGSLVFSSGPTLTNLVINGSSAASTVLTLTGASSQTGAMILLSNNGNSNPIIRYNDTSNDLGILFQVGTTTVGRFQDNGALVAGSFQTLGSMLVGDFFVGRGTVGGRLTFNSGSGASLEFTQGASDSSSDSMFRFTSLTPAKPVGIIRHVANRTAPYLQLATSSNANAGNVGGTIHTSATTVSSTSTDGTENDLHTFTIAANILARDEDYLQQVEQVATVANATASRRVRKYFAGTLIFDSGTVTTTSPASLTLKTTIIRDSSTSVRVCVDAASSNISVTASTYTTISGLTLSSTNVLKTTGTASGTGAASGDISNLLSTVQAHSGD